MGVALLSPYVSHLRGGRFKRRDFFFEILPPNFWSKEAARIYTAWHENSEKEHPLLGCASRHPSLREVEGRRGPASFATVVIVTLTIGDAGVTGKLVLLCCLRNDCDYTFVLHRRSESKRFFLSRRPPLWFTPSHTT